MLRFTATLEIIGINPFVALPARVLKTLFVQAGKERGPIPIRVTLHGTTHQQTLVKYAGAWRLYINTTMLPASPTRVGEKLSLAVAFDTQSRTLKPHANLVRALSANPAAKKVFDAMPPSGRKEIIRYIGALKTEASRERNITRAIGFLLGKNRFVGRDKP